MRKRGLLLSSSVCPFVRLSRWWIVSTTAEDIVKLLSWPGSSIILVFDPRRHYLVPKFQEEPIQQGRKIHGVGKFCDFWLKSPIISETVRDRPTVANQSVPVNLSDP